MVFLVPAVPEARTVRRVVAAALALGVLVLYSPVRNHDFVNIDDNEYVTDNPHVRGGLTADNVAWALTAYHSGHWHPLTWLSLMADCHWSDTSPAALHMGNVVLHAAGVAVLFLALTAATGQVWPSAFVAALFTLHPLRVESVAWVAARKDVLSGFFLALTLWSYATYARRETPLRYAAVAIAFALALLSKPTVAVVPCGLLLLDYWPLRRTPLLPAREGGGTAVPTSRHSLGRLVAEKIPLLALSALTLTQTMAAQQAAGAMMSTDSAPLVLRLTNALWSTMVHLGHTAWPANLAVFYPLTDLPLSFGIVGAVVILLASLGAWHLRARRPWLIVGWLWFLGTLLPVSGVVQFGGQALADRYVYIPHVGILLALTFELRAQARRWKVPQAGVAGLALIVLAACAAQSSRQLSYWRDSVTLFEHTLEATSDNFFAHNNLGAALADRGRHEEAARHYEAAVHLSPNWPEARNNFGIALARRGDLAGARENFEAALRVRPRFSQAENNLATAWAQQGDYEQAVVHYRQALEIDPGYFDARYALADGLERLGRLAEAEQEYLHLLAMRPGWEPLRQRLGRVRQALASRP